MLAVARTRGKTTMGIDWNDSDMVELIDVMIANPAIIRRYVDCSDAKELAEAINEDFPELDVSEQDIPKLVARVRARYSNGWFM